jgi:predicted nucleotidyltransferase
MIIDFEGVLRCLAGKEVKFILVGGAAAIVHGSARLTQDIDVVYDRAPDNLRCLAQALADYKPYLRGAPPGLPFHWDAETLRRGLNFTLTTTLGPVDLLGEIPGGGSYADLLPGAVEVDVFGAKCRCLSLQQLIRAKRAAGRPKDLEALAELESLDEES